MFFLTLKLTTASVLLVYAFHTIYSLASSPGVSSSSEAEGTTLVVAWLFVFGGMSGAARFYVKRPVTLLDARWIVSFMLVALVSSILFPLGSLFFRIYLSSVFFFGHPSASMATAAGNMTLIGVPLTMYIHYVIIAYKETDTRTLGERIRHQIVFFMEKKRRLLYLVVAIFFFYCSYPLFHLGNDSSGVTGLKTIALSGYGEKITSPMGREKNLYIDGIFPSGKTTDITSPIFGTKYTSSDPSVVTVSNKGVVLGVAPGRAVIQVKNGVHAVDIPVWIYVTQEEIVLRADVDGPVLPGSTVTFYATMNNGDQKVRRMSIYNDSIGWKHSMRSGDIFVFTREIPSDFTGEMRFEAHGTIDDGEDYAEYTSNVVSILLKPDMSKLTGLKLSTAIWMEPSYEEQFAYPMKSNFFLRAIGVFSDGTEYNLSDPKLGTVISSSAPSIAEPVPTISAHRPIYRVNCLEIGETEITATNNGFSATLSLEVTEARK